MLQNYGTAITDNSVTWQLVCETTYYAQQFDTGATAVYNYGNDYSGSFTAGIALTNTASGIAPQSIHVTDGTFGQGFLYGILAHDGNDLTVIGGIFGQCVNSSGCVAGLSTQANWKGDVSISGVTCIQPTICMDIAAGKNTAITNSKIFGATTAAIKIEAGVTDFSITGNLLGSSAVWGPNAAAVIVATGGSDYYNITNNMVHGSSIVDGGSGTNKTISGNN